MAKSRKSLAKPRSTAFSNQNGNCYYCKQPMCSDDPLGFSAKHGVSLRQTKILQFTGEHLVPHKDGGSSTRDNIVAVCRFCNQLRHKRNAAPSPEQYKKMVRFRMSQGRWHGLRLVDC